MAGMTMTVGFVHTLPALAVRFDEMLSARRPDSAGVHLVDAELLAEVVRSGVGPRVHQALEAHVRHLIASGSDAVLVTCSSLGEATEAAAAIADVPVLRVDTAMAERAVQLASAGNGRIAVLATLSATLGPTGRLLQRLTGEGGPTVEAVVVAGALAAREAGQVDRHDELIADAVAAAARTADVVVLAQASMAGAASRSAVGIPVLSSPDLAMDALMQRLEMR
jgi:aspartate/glutamate racemase